MFIIIIEAKQVENKSGGYLWCKLKNKKNHESKTLKEKSELSIRSFTLDMLKRQDAKLHSVHDFCTWSWDEIKDKGFYHHFWGLFIKFLPHEFLWSSISVQRAWLLVYVSSCSSFLTSNPCGPSSIPATLSAQVLVKYKRLLPKPLNNNTDSESGCVAALRSSGISLLFSFWCRLLLPSRGNPAPVHDSGLPDRHDRTPSRMACSSESRETRIGDLINGLYNRLRCRGDWWQNRGGKTCQPEPLLHSTKIINCGGFLSTHVERDKRSWRSTESREGGGLND